MATPRQPVLILYSHGRNPPLHPSPDLKYDLRNMPNPPKALRDVSDGQSKRLREHLLSTPKFTEKLNEAEREIRSAMEGKVAENGERHLREEIVVQTHCSSEVQTSRAESSIANGEVEIEENLDDLDEDQCISSSVPSILLRVGCNCALGHHRSVAFVCELAARSWPKDWLVEVVHRDLEKKRGGGAREKQKTMHKARRRFEDGGMDDD
ncbi:hypothetical protein K505DRAFT_278307 [Melanomma pulvis-pyrius CBS 109.77]|uniref:RapZ C-terminal domain-containing protein n=1 Tax=Melanomma pulvis-pyrius CBS 109.77 TaxID=1314802 RepID=A0A6A6X8I0_9PLEO|nr:hypothetical protein K505DRAFT_278307 [Melanomma pulvis-pyrius CBS 109.77]